MKSCFDEKLNIFPILYEICSLEFGLSTYSFFSVTMAQVKSHNRKMNEISVLRLASSQKYEQTKRTGILPSW